MHKNAKELKIKLKICTKMFFFLFFVKNYLIKWLLKKYNLGTGIETFGMISGPCCVCMCRYCGAISSFNVGELGGLLLNKFMSDSYCLVDLSFGRKCGV